MTTKATFIVTDIDCRTTFYAGSDTAEHKTEKSALAAAKELLNDSGYAEVYVWRLSHVVSGPDVEPDVEKVK